MRKNAQRLVVLLALGLVVACGGSGGGGGLPVPPSLHPDLIAANLFGGDAPASAQRITPEAFSALLEDGSLELVTLDLIAQQQEDEQTQMTVDRARAEELFVGRMDVLERLTTEPDPDDPEFEPLPDGGWLVKAVDADPRTGQEEIRVVVDGNRHAYAELVAVTERYRSRGNQIGLYRDLFGRLDGTFIDRNDLPEPDTLSAHTFEQLEALNKKIATLWTTLTVPPAGPPPGYPAGVEFEEGYGGGIDQAAFGPHHGMWPLLDFPLKWCATSAKWQGRRGSCVAFGITAAVEAIVARDQNRWVNLSEQMLFNRAKQMWWPSTIGDGLDTGDTLAVMRTYVYRYSWEASWDYNVSPARVALPSFYIHSCLGKDKIPNYGGEHCSESNHQATWLVTDLGFGTFCGFLDPAKDVFPDAKFFISDVYALGEPGLFPLGMAKTLLMLKIPVIISVTVPPTLRGPLVGPTGIVTYLGGILGYGGGHCMLLVGYVANADLPPGTLPGSGGGYFICKNSWGNGYGDGGYCYLPDDWVLHWTRALYAMNGVGEF